MKLRSLLLVLLCLVIAVSCVVAILSEIQIRNKAAVKTVNIGAYWDESCTSVVTEIDWGILSLGDNVSRTVYVKNLGNSEAVLKMFTSDWQPVGNYAVCSWDAENKTIAPNSVLKVTFYLKISDNFDDVANVTSFLFVIHIIGEVQ